MCNLRRWCRARDSSEKGSEGQQPDRGNMAIWARRARSSSKLVNPVVFRLGPVTCAARKALSGFYLSLDKRKSSARAPRSHAGRMVRAISLVSPMRPLCLAAAVVLGAAPAAWADVALMAGQRAVPLRGDFNSVPVLHSNQPEEVVGPGILVSTAKGSAKAETGEVLRNAEYTFNGDFGIHAHHKYYPKDKARLGTARSRGTLTIAAIAINPGNEDVELILDRGSVKNSFQAPYKANGLMGVKPQGHRPWNAGPGDATSVQMLRGNLDRELPERVIIPARSRIVLFTTKLPARGIANALVKGKSSGPFQMAVVAAEDPRTDSDLLAVLDAGRLADGRVYLDKVDKIVRREVFSRVAGVAIGDRYQANVVHDLRHFPLHVPLTTTNRHHFGTGENQVNTLASRMRDSSLDNVGTYGVRYDIDLDLVGDGMHRLMLSHPTFSGKQFTAFRGTIGISEGESYEEVHVGMRSGQSLELKSLQLRPDQSRKVRVSLVYPADATPGHLLSVVPDRQLASLRQKETLMETARQTAASLPMDVTPPPQPGEPQLKKNPLEVLHKTAGSGEQGQPVTAVAPEPTAPPAVDPSAPPVLPQGNWPPGAPAMVDPTRTVKLMRNWLAR